MQRLCLMVAIRRFEFGDRREFMVVAPPDESLLPDNAFEFEKHLLGPCRLPGSAPQFGAAAVIQECMGDTSHSLKGLVLRQSLASMRSLFIPLMSSKILLIFLHRVPLLIYGRAFSIFNSQPMEIINRNRANLLPRHRVTGLARPPGFPASQACPLFEIRPTMSSSASPQVSC